MRSGNEKTDMSNRVKEEIHVIELKERLRESEIKYRAKRIIKKKNCKTRIIKWLTKMK